jgi:hypothetical protein
MNRLMFSIFLILISDFVFSNDSIILSNVKAVKQEYSYSCGPTSLTIMYNYIVGIATEKEIKKIIGTEDRQHGMLPNEYIDYANRLFNPEGYIVHLVNASTNNEVMNTIVNYLKEGMPIAIYYSTTNDWDKPNYDTHYSVIYGIDIERQIIYLANSYGYNEEITITELINGLAFTNYKNEPIMHKFARLVGIIKKNNLIVLDHIREN